MLRRDAGQGIVLSRWIVIVALGLGVVIDALVPFPTTAPESRTGARVAGKEQQHSNGISDLLERAGDSTIQGTSPGGFAVGRGEAVWSRKAGDSGQEGPPGPNSGSSSGRMRFSENRDLSTEVRVLPLEPTTERGNTERSVTDGVANRDNHGSDLGDSAVVSGGNRGGLSADIGEYESIGAVSDGMERRTLDANAGVVRRVGSGSVRRPKAVIGTLTFYHPDLAGNTMKDNRTLYEPTMSGVAAATSWPLGTWLDVCGPTKRCLPLVISDTGRLGANHLDVPEAVFVVLAGSLAPGRVPVTVRALE